MTTTNKTNETRKEITIATANMGTSLDAAAKLAAVTTAKEAASPAFRCVLDDYIHAMKTTANAKRIKTVGATDEEATAFDFAAACLYRAAVKAADGARREADAKKLNNALFTEWKGFLVLLAGDTVKAAASDREFLVNAAIKRTKEAVTYKARTNNAGEIVASIDMGVTHSAAASISAFLKEAERLAVERILGFDGIVSVNSAKAIRDNNAGLKEAALTLDTDGMELEKAS